MTILRATSAIVAATALIAAASASAQHSPSPYSGQQSRSIKALSDREVSDLMSGAGMGFAKAAELNRYPGPMHALEHAAALDLSPGQRDALAALMKRHKAQARELGARVVSLERELDTLFASRTADEASMDRVLLALGEASARLRGSHLKAHLETTALLTAAQIDRYAEVRGYADAKAATDGGAHRH